MPPSKNDTRLCLVPECGNGINARGLCKTHWGRARTLNLLGGSGPVDAAVLEAAWLARESRQTARPFVEAPQPAVQSTPAPRSGLRVEVELLTLRGGIARVLDLPPGEYSDTDLLRRIGDRPVATSNTKLERYVVTTLFDRLIGEADDMAGTDIELLRVLRAVVLGEVPAA